MPHVNKKVILKLDIKNFFDNISFIKIYNACFPIVYFPRPTGIILTNLCTYNGHLPQGAPTSSYISNLVMLDFDEELGKWCDEKDISYTRYSDDMTFSGDFDPSEIIKKVRKMLTSLGLELNDDKIHVIKRNKSQIVTGIVVNEKVQVANKYRRKIRQEMYYIKKWGLKTHLKKIDCQEENYLNILYGKILFVLQINPYSKEFLEYKKNIESLFSK